VTRVCVVLALAIAFPAAVSSGAQDAASPIAYRNGALPGLPLLALGGGEVFLDVTVAADGRVEKVTVLRATPPFTDLVADAVRRWTFVPGVEGHVLVATLVRPPALQGPTLGEPPRDVAGPPERIPFPTATVTPSISPFAHGSGVVLVESHVDRAGTVTDAIVLQSAPPFDEGACAAVRLWKFRPARIGGQAVASVVYVLLGFPIPVSSPVIKR
jgi:TonB family protein